MSRTREHVAHYLRKNLTRSPIGGLLGSAPILEVNRFDCSRFMRHGGRVPPPLLSLRN